MKKRVVLVRPKREYPNERAKDSATEPRVVESEESSTVPPDIPPYRGVIYLGANGEKKEKITVELLFDLATQLSNADRKMLLARLALHQQQGDKPADRDLDMWSQAVYAALVAVIGHEDGAVQGPILVKRTLSAGSSWAPVAEFMRNARLDQLPVTQRQAVYMMLADLLVKHAHGVARYAKVPLSLKFVANSTAGIAAIFDAAFPGYLAAGIAHLVANRMASTRESGED